MSQRPEGFSPEARKLLGCLGWFVVVAGLIGGVLFTKSYWLPVLDGIFAKQPGPTTSAPNVQPGDTAIPNVQVPAGDRPTINICFPAFGSYFSTNLVTTFNNPAYIANIYLLQFTDSADNPITAGTEIDQTEWMKAGQMCDVLATTSDTVAANVTMGEIAVIIDRSDGADFMRAWNTGKTPGLAGKKITYVNDLIGGKIACAENSVSCYQALSWILAMQATTTDIQLVKYPTMEEAVAGFESGEADAFAGWLDTENETVLANSNVVASTEGLHTIYDVWVVNPKADAEKKPAITEFFADFFRTKKMEVENFDATASAIANWQFTFEGKSYDINSWAYISKEAPADDLIFWLETISEASFDHNIVFANNPGLVYEILTLNRKVLELGDEPLEGPFDPTKLYDPSYMLAIADRNELRPVTGTFVNTNFSPFPTTATEAPDVNKLLKLPTFIQFTCPSVYFGGGMAEIPNRTPMRDTFDGCGENYRLIMNQSPNGILVITGSAARPDPTRFGAKYTLEYSQDLAERRAIWAQTALISLGIPGNRIVITWTVGPLTQEDSVMHESRFVILELKLDDSLR